MKPSSPPAETEPELPQGRDEKPRQFESATLLGACEEVLIAHGGETYRLRRTRQDKLILTK